jgi:hypothetical protein
MEQLVARFGKPVEALFVLEMITRFARIKLTPCSGGQVITFSVASLLGPSSVISVVSSPQRWVSGYCKSLPGANAVRLGQSSPDPISRLLGAKLTRASKSAPGPFERPRTDCINGLDSV